jgi:lysophospholipase L1-like esterase
MKISCRDEDVALKARALRVVDGLVVDIRPAFGRPPRRSLYVSDGLHLSVEGQRLVVEQLLRALAESGAAAGRRSG